MSRWWNWKCALLSSVLRGSVFFASNLGSGLGAAESALATDLAFRALLAGGCGALIERLSHMRRRRLSALLAVVGVPMLAQAVEAAVHWRAGTAHLGASVAISVGLTVVSTAFNLFAMRRQAFVVGAGRAPLWRDLLRVPALLMAFLAGPLAHVRSLRNGRT
jgi:hypothetical protein